MTDPVLPASQTSVYGDVALPPFLADIAERFLSRQSNQFLLSGNVSDLHDGLGILCPAEQPDSPARYGFVDALLPARLEGRGRVVVTYDIANGIRFSSEEARVRVREWFAADVAADAMSAATADDLKRRGASFDRTLMESQVYTLVSLKFLDGLFRMARRRREGPVERGLTLVIKHAEALLPDAPLAQMADVDRQKLTMLVEWLNDPDFTASVDQVVLVADTASGLHENLRRLPHMAAIEVPRPDIGQRGEFVRWWMAQPRVGGAAAPAVPAALADLTAGMTLLTIQGLLLHAAHSGAALDAKAVLVGLNRLLTSELGDKVEVVKPTHSMADVVGASALKAELDRIRRLLAARDASVAPTGILVSGPNGVGKTFIFEAWAAECDRLVIVLKNLRGMYFGQTDQIFEKLRSVLEVLGSVIIFVDEADTVFARPGRDTHETEARLFGNVIRMMSDPKNRGRIVWLLLTARPDNLAPDLKRSGRAGLRLPVFDPEGDDRRAYVDSILRRAGIDPEGLHAEQRVELEARTATLSPADFNELLSDLKAERVLSGGVLGFDQVIAVVQALMPNPITRQRRLQTLNALLECSRRALVPPSLAGLDRDEVEREVGLLGG